jgi:hypothetical protein
MVAMSRGLLSQWKKPLLGHDLRPFQLQILYSMGSMNRPGVNPLVIGYSGGHIGDDICCANSYLEVEMVPPCLLNNSVSLQRTQALVPMGSFYYFFYFYKAFAGSDAIRDEVSHPCHMYMGKGGEGQPLTGSGPV